jgi:hypothetical protein
LPVNQIPVEIPREQGKQEKQYGGKKEIVSFTYKGSVFLGR